MKNGDEEYYCIVSLENINKNSVKSQLKKIDSFEEAIVFPNASFFVIKKKLPGEYIPGSGFFNPNVFNYKIVDHERQKHFIKYGNSSLFDFNIKTYRSGYYDAEGVGEVSILDRYSQPEIISLNTNFDFEAGVIKNLLVFLIDFEVCYNSDWKNYKLYTDLNQKIQDRDKLIEDANLQVADLKKKVSALRKELRTIKK